MAMRERKGAENEEIRCSCGGALEPAVASSYRFEDEFGRKMVVHHVPAVVCGRCGDVQVDPGTVARIERTLRRVEYRTRTPGHLDYAAD